MRIVFYGTPDFAVASLKALLDEGHEVVGVVTAPDRPAGRGHKMLPSVVKTYAQSKGLDILQPTNLKAEEFLTKIKALAPDIQIVVAFRMLPEIIWNFPPLGTYNIHASLLPNYRGAAPINWAIINGETETGVTAFKLQHEIDTGSILAQKTASIGEDETFGQLYSRLMELGASLLLESLEEIKSGEYSLTPQVVESHHRKAPKIFKADCEIDWTKTSKEVHDFVRGLNPFPGAFTYFSHEGSNDRLKIIRTIQSDDKLTAVPGSIQVKEGDILVSCANGWLKILELQMPGKRAQSSADFTRGNNDFLNEIELKSK